MMKILSILVVVVFFSGFIAAQSNYGAKGIWEFGGGASISNTTPVIDGIYGNSIFALGLKPFIGYFVYDKIQIGMMPDIEIVSTARTAGLVNIFAVPSYYFQFKDSDIYPYIHALAGFSFFSPSASQEDTSRYGFSWGVGCGIKIAMSESTTIDAGLDYIQYTLDSDGSYKNNGFNNLAVQVGFTIFLGGL